jgi:hypothetical protein
MRNIVCCLLVVLFGSWSNSLGQSAPKFTSPRIVATFERIGQTGPIPVTTILVPPYWGTFQISSVIVQTEAGGDGTWSELYKWTDGSGKQVYPFVSLNSNVRHSNNGVFAARVKGGTRLGFGVTASNSPHGKYNVWVVVEQLM